LISISEILWKIETYLVMNNKPNMRKAAEVVKEIIIEVMEEDKQALTRLGLLEQHQLKLARSLR
jgi:hypothetical protein